MGLFCIVRMFLAISTPFSLPKSISKKIKEKSITLQAANKSSPVE